MENGWQCIYTTNKMHLAEIVKAVLVDFNIDAFINDKRDSLLIGIGDIEVSVKDKDVMQAKFQIEKNNL